MIIKQLYRLLFVLFIFSNTACDWNKQKKSKPVLNFINPKVEEDFIYSTQGTLAQLAISIDCVAKNNLKHLSVRIKSSVNKSDVFTDTLEIDITGEHYIYNKAVDIPEWAAQGSYYLEAIASDEKGNNSELSYRNFNYHERIKPIHTKMVNDSEYYLVSNDTLEISGIVSSKGIVNKLQFKSKKRGITLCELNDNRSFDIVTYACNKEFISNSLYYNFYPTPLKLYGAARIVPNNENKVYIGFLDEGYKLSPNYNNTPAQDYYSNQNYFEIPIK